MPPDCLLTDVWYSYDIDSRCVNGCCAAVIVTALCTNSNFFVCAARGARALNKSIPEIVHDEYEAHVRTYTRLRRVRTATGGKRKMPFLSSVFLCCSAMLLATTTSKSSSSTGGDLLVIFIWGL